MSLNVGQGQGCYANTRSELGAAVSAGHSGLTPACLQVNFNEPLSMLQRLTEDLEYHHLLDKAVHCSSSVEQMCLVAAFSVSSYSTTVHLIAKPFNPMLGETFELDRLDDMGLRSLCEQVRLFTPWPSCSCQAWGSE